MQPFFVYEWNFSFNKKFADLLSFTLLQRKVKWSGGIDKKKSWWWFRVGEDGGKRL